MKVRKLRKIRNAMHGYGKVEKSLRWWTLSEYAPFRKQYHRLLVRYPHNIWKWSDRRFDDGYFRVPCA